MNDKYFTCDRCCYDLRDEDNTIGEHYCIDNELYTPIKKHYPHDNLYKH